MPSKTARQARAMRAAAAGKSTIGIPKNVGKEFMQADILRGKPDRNGNQNQGKPKGSRHGRYSNYTDPTGKKHIHWTEGKSYSTGGQAPGSSGGIGGAAAGGGS